MDPEHIVNDNTCVLVASEIAGDALASISGRFNRVVADIAKVYPSAILVGAVAAAQYITYRNEPRITYDVDILLEEKDFSDFVTDEIPEEKLVELETRFKEPDTSRHSLQHRETGMYVDILSLESKALRRKTVRYILNNRDEATNTFKVAGRSIAILKPELIIAMKLNRYSKWPQSERGLCDRVDIIKVLRALWAGEITVDQDTIETFCNQREADCFADIMRDIDSEMQE